MKRIFYLIALIGLFLFLSGCEKVTRTEPYITSFQQDPNILKSQSDFTILYKVVNPKDSPDELYLKVSIPKESNDCIELVDYRLTNGKVPLGEIKSKSEKFFYTNFRTTEKSESRECNIQFDLYTSAQADTSVYGVVIKVDIAQQTRA